MTYDVKLEDGTAQPTACARETVPDGDVGRVFPRLLGEVWAYLQSTGIEPAGPPYDRSTWQPGMRLEVGFPVAQPIDGDGRVVPGELPGGPRAVTVHTGPYDQLRGAFQAVTEWMQERGLKASGPGWEMYLTDPSQVTDPAQLQTLVAIPVA
jgi:effector-binding domain-containing protein